MQSSNQIGNTVALFVVIPLSDEFLENEPDFQTIADKSLRMPRGEWLVKYDGVSKDLSDLLEMKGDYDSSAVVFRLTGSYYGYASPDIWEWLEDTAKD